MCVAAEFCPQAHSHDSKQVSYIKRFVLARVYVPFPWLLLSFPSRCEPGRPLNVAVLVSGGVDSSLALRLLHAAGHRCRAFYLQIWFQEDFRNFWDACPWEEDLEYARKVG